MQIELKLYGTPEELSSVFQALSGQKEIAEQIIEPPATKKPKKEKVTEAPITEKPPTAEKPVLDREKLRERAQGIAQARPGTSKLIKEALTELGVAAIKDLPDDALQAFSDKLDDI